MKEKLYTIPVNEAYEKDTECPICDMKQSLEDKAVSFTMGSSYMEDDIRAVTNKVGFCNIHLPLLYQEQNRLGLALMLKTHMDTTIKHIEKLSSKGTKLPSPSFFRRKEQGQSPLVSYVESLDTSCYICSQVDNTFERYIETVFVLYRTDDDFRRRLKESKGYCTSHYGLLYDKASNYLKDNQLETFLKELNTVYIENMKRVIGDLDWFIDKFDYRNKDASWKNSKDALLRTMTKTASVYESTDK